MNVSQAVPIDEVDFEMLEEAAQVVLMGDGETVLEKIPIKKRGFMTSQVVTGFLPTVQPPKNHQTS